MASAALRELAAAFPDRTPEELAEVLAAAGGRGDLAAETLLAEALLDQDEAEESTDEDADPQSPGAAQLRADAEYASLLQVCRRRLRHVNPHACSVSRQSRRQTQLLAPNANAPPVSSFLASRINHP
jgi:hypothetical protein